ncbi:sensor histidine kinase [Chryseomicrobium palamuruense]|uniref:histidine kinase n=1 Tax=Chryseomicrobium palamuruense TaxID=682973 RepID=A0ABV8UXP4_9BACL
MSETTLHQLCRLYTNLKAEDIAILEKVADTLPQYAELTGNYMYIDCLLQSGDHGIVVAEALPRTPDAAYKDRVLGKLVFEAFEPAVLLCHKTGRKSLKHRAITQEGKVVEQSVIPIYNDSHEVIGTLIMEADRSEESSAPNGGTLPIKSMDMGPFSDNPMVADLLMEIIFMTDDQQRLVYANPSGIKFLHEIQGERDWVNQPVGHVLPFLEGLLHHKEEVFISEVLAGQRVLEVKKVHMRTKRNELEGLLFIIQDLTELRLKEKELLKKSVVIKEIHHRVKNNLQTVASLLRLQMRKGLSVESKSHFEDTLHRVYSISAVYELILANEDADQDDVDVIELTSKIGSTMMLNDLDHQIEFRVVSNGYTLLASSRKAVSIALIVNELVQNSLKHAFPHQAGTICVEFKVKQEFIEMHISDDGKGMEGYTRSLGLDIVRNLIVNDLEGEFVYKQVKKGTHASIIFPIHDEILVHSVSVHNRVGD